ncbi:DUF1178 family protein [Paracoccus indicus]|uniref:DUF1178 family protein n=1 Tax=Paracoccus indicus TaxID=2079229 RepID=UPI000D384087|nr:DUF1178 family protein [Paracoccus indicus]
MIRYALRCANGHVFDSWFRSSDGYDAMRAAGQVACTSCGSTDVDKTLMAPAVSEPRPISAPASPAETALEKLRRHVESTSDYVGSNFVKEARAMHQGQRPERAIHGEARIEDARKLIEDGVPIAPLPFLPRQKAN